LPGHFDIDIGATGSGSLVLQTIAPALSFASAMSTLTLTGGTHVPWSPCFHYLALHWLHYMRRIGFNLQLELEVAGFYPRGGGRVRAVIQPASELSPLHLTKCGPLKRIRGISAAANLNASVAERQREQALKRLSEVSSATEIEILRLSSSSQGTFLLLLAEFENRKCGFPESRGTRQAG
jgi:RNA 3'-terminal phosphate cyclase (ATP)